MKTEYCHGYENADWHIENNIPIEPIVNESFQLPDIEMIAMYNDGIKKPNLRRYANGWNDRISEEA